MLLLSTSLLSVAQTKTGQTPQKGAKPLAQKNTKKQQTTTKTPPKTEKVSPEEDAIIRAAEKYHQQISGKKVDTETSPGTGQKAVTPATGKQTVTSKKSKEAATSATGKTTSGTGKASSATVKATSGTGKATTTTGKTTSGTGKATSATGKTTSGTGKATVAPKKGKEALIQNLNAAEAQSNGSGRDPNVNIYTGNPGIYRADGDTLNFWSFTPVPADTMNVRKTFIDQPGKPYGFEGKLIKRDAQDWTFFLIIIGWIIFASLRFGFSKYVVQVVQSAFNYSASSRLYRERGYSSNFGMFRLNLIFFLFLPLPIFLIAKDNGVSLGGFSGIEFYLIVSVVVNAYFMLKILLYKILGSVFSQRETTGELIFNMMLYHNVLGLTLLPLATIHYMVPGFGPFSLFIVPGMIAIFYLMSITRSIYFALREGISIFYLILYLCALEILPILLMVKVATGG